MDKINIGMNIGDKGSRQEHRPLVFPLFPLVFSPPCLPGGLMFFAT